MPEPEYHDGLTHLVGEENDRWTRATGGQQEALCGHRFTPSRDPGKFPLCPKCKERADREHIQWTGAHRR